MPLGYYPGIDDRDYANRLRTISPSVPPADYEIPVLPPSPDKSTTLPPPSPDNSKMLPPPTPSTKGKEKDVINVGGLLMDLAKDGSEDGTSTSAEKKAGAIPPAPTKKEAGTTPSAPTGHEAGTTPEKPTHPKQYGTPKPNRPASPSCESSSSEDDTKDEDYMSCILEWLGLDPDCKTMLDDETKMLAHHERRMGSKAVPIFQQAVNHLPTSSKPSSNKQ